jgi:hypothetical protein
MALIVTVMYFGDHRRLLRGYRHQILVLDSAFTNHVMLVAHLEQLLDARVHSVTVQRLDMVNETTVVDVRFALTDRGRTAEPAEPAHSGAHR